MKWLENASTQDTSMQSLEGWSGPLSGVRDSSPRYGYAENDGPTGIESDITNKSLGTVSQAKEAGMDSARRKKRTSWIRRIIDWCLLTEDRKKTKEQRNKADKTEMAALNSKSNNNKDAL